MVVSTNCRIIGGKSYYGEMLQFFAIPGASGQIRLKIQTPLDAEGAMVRYKTTPWDTSDGIATGTLVANITDDSAYKGANQWYTVTGLTNGTTYYFKAFPKKGHSYNAAPFVNETRCVAGGLYLEYTFDSISGNTILDTSGNGRNATASNVSYVQSLVGNGAKGNGNSYINMPTSYPGNATFSVFIKPNEDVLSLVGERRAISLIPKAQNNQFVLWAGKDTTYVGYKSNTFISFPIMSASERSFYCAKNTGSIGKIRKNGGEWTPISVSTSLTGSEACRLLADWGSSLTSYSYSELDSFRIFDRELEDYEVDALYNGGAGC